MILFLAARGEDICDIIFDPYQLIILSVKSDWHHHRNNIQHFYNANLLRAEVDSTDCPFIKQYKGIIVSPLRLRVLWQNYSCLYIFSSSY